MHAKAEVLQQSIALADTPAIVVVGAGPVGMRVADEILQRMGDVPLVIYGDEPWLPYDRAALSHFLAGELDISQLYKSLPDENKTVFLKPLHSFIL